MKQLYVKPQVHKFDRFADFAKEFGLTDDDLIFTEQFLYDTFIKDLKLPCSVLLRDPFGLGEPSDVMIDQIAGEAKKYSYKRVIAVGGGSVIDIAKIFQLKDNVPSAKIFLKETPIVKEKQLVIIPTTCGTGSEMTNLSIANITAKETKMGIGDDCMYADYSVLIPQLVEGLPYKFYVFSAVDALVHAMESYINPKSNAFSESYSLTASQMILDGFVQMVQKGPDSKKELAGNFLIASCMAGIAFGNVGVGPVHALAYPLGGVYHVPHGETNYQFFTEVFNMYQQERPGEKLNVLSNLIIQQVKKLHIECEVKDAFDKLDELLGKLLPLKDLKEYGMKEEEIEIFAKSVIDNQQRLLVNSYVPFTFEHAKKIYTNRYSK
jgi:4-hydroxybutyrate dehydrogenase